MSSIRGSTWFAAAVITYIVAAVLVVVFAWTRRLLGCGQFWDGVIGNAMATLIQLVVLSAIAGAALYRRERVRWGYARNLAHARLVNTISIAWEVVGGANSSVYYQFGSITTDMVPDFRALNAPSESLKRDEVGERRARRAKYDSEAVAVELKTLSDKLATVIETLENTLALVGNQCDPELWTVVLRAIEEIKRFRMFVSGADAADLILPTSVLLDVLAETGVAVTRNASRESPDAWLKRNSLEVQDSLEKVRKALAKFET